MTVVSFGSENDAGGILYALLLLSQSQESDCSFDPAPEAVAATPHASKTICMPSDVAAGRFERQLRTTDVA